MSSGRVEFHKMRHKTDETGNADGGRQGEAGESRGGRSDGLDAS